MITELRLSSSYLTKTKQYKKKDALLASLLYSIVFFMITLFGVYISHWSDISELHIFLATGCFSFLCIGLVILFCRLQGQTLATIGFSREHAQKSFLFGILFFLVIFFYKGIVPLMKGMSIKVGFMQLTGRFIYFLVFISFMEELIFRGYIGTRFYGCMKHKLLAAILVSILFSLEHVPFKAILADTSFLSYIASHQSDLYSYFLWGMILQYFYGKYNSIIGPVLLHAGMDFTLYFLSCLG